MSSSETMKAQFKELLKKQESVHRVEEGEIGLEVIFKNQKFPFTVIIRETEPQVQNIIGKYEIEMIYVIPNDSRYITVKRFSHHTVEKVIRSMLNYYEKQLRFYVEQINQNYEENTGKTILDSFTSKE